MLRNRRLIAVLSLAALSATGPVTAASAQPVMWDGAGTPTAYAADIVAVAGGPVSTGVALLAGDGRQLDLVFTTDVTGTADEIELTGLDGLELVSLPLVSVQPITVNPPTSRTAMSLAQGHLGIRLNSGGTAVASGTFTRDASTTTWDVRLYGSYDATAPQVGQCNALTFPEQSWPFLGVQCEDRSGTADRVTISQGPAGAGGPTLLDFTYDALGAYHQAVVGATPGALADIAAGEFHVAVWSGATLVMFGDPGWCASTRTATCTRLTPDPDGYRGYDYRVTSTLAGAGGGAPRAGWGYMLLTNFVPAPDAGVFTYPDSIAELFWSKQGNCQQTSQDPSQAPSQVRFEFNPFFESPLDSFEVTIESEQLEVKRSTGDPLVFNCP